MLASYAVGLGSMLALLVAWVAVQNAWRKTFPAADERVGCGGCGSAGRCNREEKP